MLHSLLVITVAVLAAASPNPPLGPNAASNELNDGRAGTVLAAASRFPAELNVAPNEFYEDSADAVQAAASPFPAELTVAPYKLYENSPSTINFADKELSDLISGMPVGAKLVDAVNKASTGDTKDLIDKLECPICLEHFDTATLATLACGHTFHEGCYRGDGRNRCALCRHVGKPDDILSRETDLRKFLGLLESKQWIAPAQPPPPPPSVQPDQTPAGPADRFTPMPVDPEDLPVWTEMVVRLDEVLRAGIDEIRRVDRSRVPRRFRSGLFNRRGNETRARALRRLIEVMHHTFGGDPVADLQPPGPNMEFDASVDLLEELARRAVTRIRAVGFRGYLCDPALSEMRAIAREFTVFFPKQSRAMGARFADSIARICQYS